jgi:negative regulator of flagellin synthesis FlgM
MKIGNIQAQNVTAPAAGERKASAASTGASAPAAGVEASATVDLSATASLLAQSSREASFDQAKVERVAQAISDGSYKIDAGAIADKLIANAQDVLGRRPV